MNLSKDQLHAFFEVSRIGSFTRAAAHLGLTQSALSHRIKNLEGQLEVTLLIREPSGLQLTEAGKKLLQYCQLQIQIENELLADLKKAGTSQLSGHLRIGGASTVLWSVVIPALSDLLKAHPLIRIDMMERELRELPSLLHTGRADFIVTCGEVEEANLESIYIGDEVNVLVEARKKTLRSNVYLDHDANDQTTMNFLKRHKKHGGKIERSFMDNIHGIISGVEAGLGRAVLPRHLIQGNPRIQIVNQALEMKVPVNVYFQKQPFLSKLHQSVIATLGENSGRFLKSSS